MLRGAVAVGLLAFGLAGCGFFAGRHAPERVRSGAVEQGVASWYGPGFHGRRTSSGEVYDQRDLTAAHQTLPLGTRVAVTNLDNGQSIEVRVNDRGPFVGGRIIDLSYGAASAIGMIGPGTARVRVEVLGSSARALPAATYAVQVGSFTDSGNAEDLRRRLALRVDGVYIARLESERLRYYRVRVGPYESRDVAARVADRVAALGYSAVIMEEAPVGSTAQR